MSQRLRISLLVPLFLFSVRPTSTDAQETWTGLGGNNNWSTDANWQDGTAPASGPTQQLVFQGSVSPTQDVMPFFEVNSINIGAGGSRIVNGNPIRISGTDPLIENTSTVWQQIMAPIQLNAPLTELRAAGSGVLRISGMLSEIGGARGIKVTSGEVIAGPLAYTGPTIIDGGRLSLGGHSYSPAPVTLLGGAFGTFGGSVYEVRSPVNIQANIEWLNLEFKGPVTLTGSPELTFNRRSTSIGPAYSGFFYGNIGEAAPGAGFVKKGQAQMIVAGTTSFTGAVIVAEGGLRVDGKLGSLANPVGGIEIHAGTSLFALGTGEIVNAPDKWLVCEGGSRLLWTISASEISITGAGVELQAGASYYTLIGGEVPGEGLSGRHSQLDVFGAVKLGDGVNGPILELPHVINYVPPIGAQYMIIDNDLSDLVMGTFEGLAEGATITKGNFQYQISYRGGDGNDVVLTAVAIIPEPTSLVLLVAAAIACVRRR